MKKSLALLTCAALIGSQAHAAGIGGMPSFDEKDGKFSMGAGYYYQHSEYEGIDSTLADDALSDIVRDAPYLRANYHLNSIWTISGIYGYEDITNDPNEEALKLDSDLRDTFFGFQVTGRLYQSEEFDVGAFVQFTSHADYDLSGTVQSNEYRIEVNDLHDLLAGAIVQRKYHSFDLYGGVFYQDSSADVTGTTSQQWIGNTLELSTSIGGMLGAIFHVHEQWDIGLEYQNRGDHGMDISATYHFAKPKPRVITKIVEIEVPVEVPVVKPESFEGIINFPDGSAEIQKDQRMIFRKLALFVEENPEANIYVEGHCDCQGPESANQELSIQRAIAVKSYLVDYYAIDADRITAEGFGELQPIATNDTAEGRQQNRRVRILATSKESAKSN